MEHHTAEWNNTIADVSVRESSANRSVEPTLHLLLAITASGQAERLTLKRLEQFSVEVRAAAKAIAERYDGGSGGS